VRRSLIRLLHFVPIPYSGKATKPITDQKFLTMQKPSWGLFTPEHNRRFKQ